jgi:hypothetical protein
MGESELKLLRQTGRVKGVSEVAYVGHFHPVRAGHQDRVSASLRRFSEGTEPHLSRWIELAAPRVAAELSFDLIVRVLRHDETAAQGTAPLDRLCDEIAMASGKPYVPHRLIKKRATKPLEELVGKAARAAEIDGVLRFDGSSIRPDAKVLVVDSLLWTGATMEAVAGAIHAQLPQAQVIAFVLTRADATSGNVHLNPDYFEGTSTTPAGSPVPARKGGARAKQSADAKPAQAGSMSPDAPTEVVHPDAPAPPARSRISASTTIIGGMAIVFLIIGALVPLRSSKKPPEMPDPLVEPLEVSPPETAREISPAPKVEPVRTAEPSYPQGVVIVPDAGLRQSASLTARMVGKTALKDGEKVSIVKRYKPDVGPTWVQVKTKSGKVGWVFASVVQERKPRKK